MQAKKLDPNFAIIGIADSGGGGGGCMCVNDEGTYGGGVKSPGQAAPTTGGGVQSFEPKLVERTLLPLADCF